MSVSPKIVDPARSRRRIGIAIALPLLGALMGSVLAGYLKGYQATIALPFDGDVPLFRQTEQEIRTRARRSAFASTHNPPQEREIFDRFTDLLDSRQVQIDHVFGLSRRDLLDLPDVAAKGLKFERPGRSVIRVTAKDADSKVARLTALATIEYLRGTLAALRSELLLTGWKDESRAARDEIEYDLAKTRLQIGSTTRQIDAAEKLQMEYKNAADWPIGSPQGSTVEASPQVQPQGQENVRRYLSPLRQILALKSALIDESEKLNVLQEKLEYLNALRSFASGPRVAVLDRLIEDADKLTHASGASDPNGRGRALAHAEIRKQLSKIRQDLIDVSLEPVEPDIKKVGGGFTLVLLGAMTGLLLGLGWIYAGVARNWWTRGDLA